MSNTPLKIKSLATTGDSRRVVPDMARLRWLRRSRLPKSPKPTSHNPTRGGPLPNGQGRGPALEDEVEGLTVVGTFMVIFTGEEPLGVT